MTNDVRWGGFTLANLDSKQLDFLKAVLNHPKESRLLTGCAGSGKTLLAAFALDYLRQDAKIDAGFLVFTKLLEKFVKDNFDAKSTVFPIDHYNRWELSPQKRDTYVLDESQDFRESWIKLVQANSQSQIWIGDAQQQIYEEARQDKGYSNLVSSFNEAQKTNLTINYRNPLSIAKFACNFMTLSPEEMNDGLTLKDKQDSFILPIAKNVTLSHDDPVLLIKADTVDQEFDAIAKWVSAIQSNPLIPGKKIAIAHMLHGKGEGSKPHKDTLDEIQNHLEKRGVSFERIVPGMKVGTLPNFQQKSLVILSAIHGLKGLEVDYVVLPRAESVTNWVDPVIRDNLLFVLFTRARYRVVCSYVDDKTNYILDKLQGIKALGFVEKIQASDYLKDHP